MDWLFNGLGTAILTLIIGLLTGGAVGYKICINKNIKIKQRQKSRDNSSQIQIGKF